MPHGSHWAAQVSLLSSLLTLGLNFMSQKQRKKTLKWREVLTVPIDVLWDLLFSVPEKKARVFLLHMFYNTWNISAVGPDGQVFWHTFSPEKQINSSVVSTQKDWEMQALQIKMGKITSLQVSKYYMNYMYSAQARCLPHTYKIAKRWYIYLERSESLLSTISSTSI